MPEALSAQLARHHVQCDERFAEAEAAAADEKWDEAGRTFAAFRSAIEAHFGTEEDVVFPAFERATGMVEGPTQVMRTEHRQMRGLMGQMQSALTARDAAGFGGAADTLLILMQQHNLKEENILYPMCDNAIAAPDVAQQVSERLAA